MGGKKEMNNDYIVKLKKDSIVVDVDIDPDSITKADILCVIERILSQTKFGWAISYNPNKDACHIFIREPDDE